ncbi:MAG TPA: glycine/sarcosine/betaine reductase selenoprotein B family protein [Chloroflexaceae bacterium]|nr:glycine/sarcosine/betaine reductase selenoprotein B family protein [Chloroflexaceae bacterium]
MLDRDRLRQLTSSAFGQLLSRAPALARLWGRGFAAVPAGEAPFAPLRKPLRECRLALVTTGGVHLRSQRPFDMGDSRGDPSFRAIPADTPAAALMITHDYYDHAAAERDLNVLFPLALGRELVARGAVGALGTCYSFMGHIEPPHVATLVSRTAPEVARRLRQEQVDAVLLTPA